MDLASAVGLSHGDRRPWVTARLLAIDTVTNRAQIARDGSAPVWLPYITADYTGITTVYLMTDPANGGAGQLVLGPCYAEAPEVVPAAPPEPDVDAVVAATALIRPLGSASYRHIRAAWDRWNMGSHGGGTTLYQGDRFGSGQMTGLAWYGSQVVNLGAVSITAVRVATPLATNPNTVTLQGAPHASKPSGAPAPTGDTATGDASVALTTNMREGLRTGVIKSLATVGSAYRGTYGSAHPSGLALSITYTKRA